MLPRMWLVAVARTPQHPDEAARALAAATGLTLAEARMRLAPEPPALVARLDAAPAAALAGALRRAGLAALALDARVPSDRDRVVAHRFELSPAGAAFAPRAGAPVTLAWSEVAAVLRGLRAERESVEHTETVKRLSVGRALMTSGLSLGRTERRTTRSSEEQTEQVILVYPRAGEAVLLSERELDFSCLAPAPAPSATANMTEIARLLRARTPGAFHDDRLLRLGRRPLPFVGDGASRSQASSVVVTRSATAGSLDTLAEAMRQALAAGLLP
jgi:hypothetical protein